MFNKYALHVNEEEILKRRKREGKEILKRREREEE